MNRTNETADVLESGRQVNHAVHVQVKQIAFVGLMGAVSTVLMLLRFPLPFLPPFMSFDPVSYTHLTLPTTSRV